MSDDFEKILDECVDRLNHGESIDACLADYPQFAAQIGPLLKTMDSTKESYSFTPSDDVKRAARQRLYAAIDKRRSSFWQRLFARRLVLVTAIGVIALLVVGGYLGLRATILEPEPTTFVTASPSPEGNFVFLVTDEVNAIGDFNNLNITIDRVNLVQRDSANKVIEFVPQTREFNLALLPNGKTQQLWQGNIPEGQYADAVIYVSKVAGDLKATGQTLDIKLPSSKLQMSRPFEVGPNSTTSFVYDLTVVKAGNAQNGEKYLLKPQIDTSGASHSPRSENAKPDQSRKK